MVYIVQKPVVDILFPILFSKSIFHASLLLQLVVSFAHLISREQSFINFKEKEGICHHLFDVIRGASSPTYLINFEKLEQPLFDSIGKWKKLRK